MKWGTKRNFAYLINFDIKIFNNKGCIKNNKIFLEGLKTDARGDGKLMYNFMWPKHVYAKILQCIFPNFSFASGKNKPKKLFSVCFFLFSKHEKQKM